MTSTDWSKASDFQSEEKSTRAPEALIQKRAVSIVFVDPTSFSWWLFSGSLRGANVDRLTSSWLEGATNIVLTTLGAKGVIVKTIASEFLVPANHVRVTETIGAGDTFIAGFLAGLSRQNILSKSALVK